jgi:MFS family permease
VRDPLIRGLIVVLTCVAGFLLPLTTLVLPLLGRQNGWAAKVTGLAAGTYVVGSALVGLTIARRGGASRPGWAVVTGLAVAAVATGGVAFAETPWVAAAGLFFCGIGTGLFTTHAAPLLLGGTPKTHIARIQSFLLLAQTVPLLIANAGIGFLADITNARAAGLVCAGGIFVAALVALGNRRIMAGREVA